MTKAEAQDRYAVESFGDGFIVADFSGERGKFGEAYMGADRKWHSQPINIDRHNTFKTEDEAWRAVSQ